MTKVELRVIDVPDGYVLQSVLSDKNDAPGIETLAFFRTIDSAMSALEGISLFTKDMLEGIKPFQVKRCSRCESTRLWEKALDGRWASICSACNTITFPGE